MMKELLLAQLLTSEVIMGAPPAIYLPVPGMCSVVRETTTPGKSWPSRWTLYCERELTDTGTWMKCMPVQTCLSKDAPK